jgi:hypothetical protein
VAEHVTHALEVLVDPHAHELDLQAELLQLVVEGDAQRDRSLAVAHQPNRPVM